MAAREIPEPWSHILVKAGAVDPRNGNPSLSALGRMSDTHTTTVAKLILRRDPTVSRETREAVAQALGIDPGELDKWVGEEPADPYRGPKGSEHLTGAERRALDNIISIILKAKEHGSERADEPEKTVADQSGPGEKTNVAEFRPRSKRRDTSRMAARRTQDDDSRGN